MIVGEEHCGPGGCKLRIAGVSKVFDGRRGKVVVPEAAEEQLTMVKEAAGR